MATLQVLKTYYSHVMRVDFAAIPAAHAGILSGLAAQVEAGTLSPAAANKAVARLAVDTTAVASLAYQFFTGTTPYSSGLDYLVSPQGPNPNNLNSAYYQHFNLENRYINFAVNLAAGGEGQARFAQAYGGLDLRGAFAKAFAEILGYTPDAARISEFLDVQVGNGRGGTFSRADYFATFGQDGINGIRTKAAAIGWLLAEAAKAEVGPYAEANAAFLADVGPDGVAKFHASLLAAYAPQTPSPAGATLTVGADQSVSPAAGDPALRSTSGADTITVNSDVGTGRTISTGHGDDVITVNGRVHGNIVVGDGNATVVLNGGLGDPSPAVRDQTASVTFGGGNNTLYLNGSTGFGTKITATGTNNTLHIGPGFGDFNGSISGFQTVIVEAPGKQFPPAALFNGQMMDGIQTIYARVPSTFGPDARVFISVLDQQVVLQDTSYGVSLTYGGSLRQNIEVHLDHFTGATTTTSEYRVPFGEYAGTWLFNGGGISAFNNNYAGARPDPNVAYTLTVHVDSDSTAGMIYGQIGYTGFGTYPTLPIPNLKIVGAGALTAQIFSTFRNIDATAAGDLNLTYAVPSHREPSGPYETGGPGAFLFSNGANTLSVSLGHDVRDSYARDTKFVLGSGVDNFVVTKGGTGLNNLAIVNGAISARGEIVAFQKGVDRLNLDAVTDVVLANLQSYADGAASLTEAVTRVSAQTALNATAAFTYGGDTYVYQQDTAAGVNMAALTHVGDGLIRLVGVTGLTVGTGTGAFDIHYA